MNFFSHSVIDKNPAIDIMKMHAGILVPQNQLSKSARACGRISGRGLVFYYPYSLSLLSLPCPALLLCSDRYHQTTNTATVFFHNAHPIFISDLLIDS
jgi:hypothetical protein